MLLHWRGWMQKRFRQRSRRRIECALGVSDILAPFRPTIRSRDRRRLIVAARKIPMQSPVLTTTLNGSVASPSVQLERVPRRGKARRRLITERLGRFFRNSLKRAATLLL